MARNLDSALAAALASGLIRPAFLADLTFRSGVEHVWSGVGALSWSGNTYSGLGELAGVGSVSESSGVQADGTKLWLTVGPSQIGTPVQSLLMEALSDVRIGAPADLWFGLLDAGMNFIGSPFLLFGGLMDDVSIAQDPKGTRIELSLENRLRNLQRGGMRRYTAADQKLDYPTDSGFNWVEILQEISLIWGA